MTLAESLLTGITLTSMAIALMLSIIPFIPGPATIWAIGVVYALLTQFEQVTTQSVVLMTALMVIGSTTELWMPLLGIRSKGMSCLSVIGSLFGSVFGTVFIPVPLVGTIVGGVAGALVVEFVRVGQPREALRAGRAAFQLYLIGFAVEFVTSLAIIAVFIISLAAGG